MDGKKRLPSGGNLWHIHGGSRLWWNWQTRYFEVVVGKPVQVQVLLSAPSPFPAGIGSPTRWFSERG